MVKKISILFMNEFWILLKEMSPWLLLGFFFSGILKSFFSENKISSHLGQSNLLSVIKSSLFGIPLPLCSCGVVPVAVSLNRNGASKGAVASFLISTPQTGVDSIAATYGVLGFPFAIIRLIMALFSGIFGGVIVNLFIKSPPNINCNSNHVLIDENKALSKANFLKKIFKIFRYGFIEMIQDLAKWILIGLVLATLFSILLSEHLIVNTLNSSWKEFLFMGLISIPLYVCATGSIPIALIFISKGISPGSILLFLMLGPATNITTVTVLINSLGKKFTIIYLIALTLSSIFFAVIVNFFWIDWFLIQSHSVSLVHNFNFFNTISAIILLILLFNAFFFNFFSRNIMMDRRKKSFSIEGMSCNHCKISVEKNLSRLQGVDFVQVNLESKKVLIYGNFSKYEVEKCINELGFKFKI